MKLTPCTSCARLVRAGDAACPFCSAAIVAAPEVSLVPRHLSRAAMLVGAAAIGVACSTSSQPVYGSPVVDSGVDDAKSDGGPVPMYGGPPADGGLDASPDVSIAAYGGPPLDASKQD